MMFSTQEDIAIVGLSCIYPGAACVEEFWNNILSKKHNFSNLPTHWQEELFHKSAYDFGDTMPCVKGSLIDSCLELNPADLPPPHKFN